MVSDVMKSTYNKLQKGYNLLVSRAEHPDMMDSEFGVLVLDKGESYALDAQEEYVFCLNCGAVRFAWDDQEKTVERKSCFRDDPFVLHICAGTKVSVTAISDHAEINMANTHNEKHFANKLYNPEDLLCSEVVDQDKLGGKTMRHKRVFFNRQTCPETNLFCGEVVNYPGCWACFPPHLHTEPEIYYYKFFPAQGYGFAEYGNDAIKVKNNSVTCNPGGQLHSQSTAPGYAGYIMWTQRLQDNGKDIVYGMEQEHAWLDEPGVKIFPELKEE